MVPLRNAMTLFGRPALISDCAPIMLRVRPAQLTTTVVAGDGAISRARNTSSAPGTLVEVGIDTREYSSNGRLSSTTRSAPSRISCSSSERRDIGRVFGVLDIFAERLARHVDAREQFEARRTPARHAAVENGNIGIAIARQDRGGTLRETVTVIAQHDAGTAPRHETRRTATRSGSAAPIAPAADGSARRSVSSRTSTSASSLPSPIMPRRSRGLIRRLTPEPADHVACCGVICFTSPVLRSKRTRLIWSRLVPVTRTKRAKSG